MIVARMLRRKTKITSTDEDERDDQGEQNVRDGLPNRLGAVGLNRDLHRRRELGLERVGSMRARCSATSTVFAPAAAGRPRMIAGGISPGVPSGFRCVNHAASLSFSTPSLTVASSSSRTGFARSGTRRCRAVLTARSSTGRWAGC